jgi:hypothetical protein
MKKYIGAITLALAASALLASSAHADRTLTAYTGNDYEDALQAGSGGTVPGAAVAKNINTTAGILSFLYIKGNLSAEVTIDGWGNKKLQLPTEYLDIYHNESLSFSFSGFNNPITAGGNPNNVGGSAIQSNIEQESQIAGITGQNGDTLWDSPNGFSTGLNTFVPPAVSPADDGGYMRLKVDRWLQPFGSTGPGVYTNTGQITITRS